MYTTLGSNQVSLFLISYHFSYQFSLEAGPNNFPFTFKLPPNCPPSFDGKFGRIRYLVRCELDRPEVWRFNDRIEAEFLGFRFETQAPPINQISVIPKIDLNSMYLVNEIKDKNVSKNTGMLFKNGKVYVRVGIFNMLQNPLNPLKAQLPREGYTPGENIPILIKIDNQSCKPTTRVRAYLQQNSRFNYNVFHTEKLQKCEIKCSIAPFKSDTILLNLRIPELTTPSFESKLISVNYNVMVALDTLSVFEGTLEWEFPIVIGTVPIGNPETLRPAEMFEEPLAPEETLSIGPPPSYQECCKQTGFWSSPSEYEWSFV